MINTHGETSGRVEARGTDHYGRWSWLSLKGKKCTVTFVSVYQIGNSHDHCFNTKKGCKTFRLELYIQGFKDGKQGTPEETFLQDLLAFLGERNDEGKSLVVCGDFNEVFEEGGNSFALAETLGLSDVLNLVLHTTTFNTHQRNQTNQRIDYSLVSPHITNVVVRVGYFPFGLHFKGDHCSFYIDFNIDSQIGGELNDIITPPKQLLHSKHKQNRAQYVQAKYLELWSTTSLIG